MLIISHRANMNSPDSTRENNPISIKETIELGFPCEIDVRMIGKELFLGHDSPLYKIDIDFLIKNSNVLFIHCKDFSTLDYLQEFKELNIFFHYSDNHTFTSKGYVWTHLDAFKTTRNGIMVMKDKPTKENLPINCLGICTDWPILAREIYEKNEKNSHL